MDEDHQVMQPNALLDFARSLADAMGHDLVVVHEIDWSPGELTVSLFFYASDQGKLSPLEVEELLHTHGVDATLHLDTCSRTAEIIVAGVGATAGMLSFLFPDLPPSMSCVVTVNVDRFQNTTSLRHRGLEQASACNQSSNQPVAPLTLMRLHVDEDLHIDNPLIHILRATAIESHAVLSVYIRPIDPMAPAEPVTDPRTATLWNLRPEVTLKIRNPDGTSTDPVDLQLLRREDHVIAVADFDDDRIVSAELGRSLEVQVDGRLETISLNLGGL